MSPLNLIPSGVDSVSFNLRDISVHLQELKLVNTTIAYDFMCPLDEEGQPELGSLHLNWPYLEILELESIPPWLPSGMKSVSPRIIKQQRKKRRGVYSGRLITNEPNRRINFPQHAGIPGRN
jgi:hypothetical protein